MINISVKFSNVLKLFGCDPYITRNATKKKKPQQNSKKADVMHQNLSNQLHPKKWGRFFPRVAVALNRLPGSILEDVARLGLFAHGERKEG